jgi:hypothetical protein
MVLACGFLIWYVRRPDDERIKATCRASPTSRPATGSSLSGRENKQGLTHLAPLCVKGWFFPPSRVCAGPMVAEWPGLQA